MNCKVNPLGGGMKFLSLPRLISNIIDLCSVAEKDRNYQCMNTKAYSSVPENVKVLLYRKDRN